jgi:methyl-accepting chemotaxis protein
MRNKSDLPSRHEVVETVETHAREEDEKLDELDIIATDDEIVSETIEDVDIPGTSEAKEKVEAYLDEAKEITEEKFEEGDEQLEETVNEAEEHGEDLQERSDGSNVTLGEIVDASGRIETQETVDEMVTAKEGVLEDIEFLDEQIQENEAALSETQQERNDLKNRVNQLRR